MDKILNVTDFLRQFENYSTIRGYKTSLKQFFMAVYPELKKHSHKLEVDDLDVLANRYLGEERDYRSDLLDFRDSLKDKAPTTSSNRINKIRVYLDENGISFRKRFLKNLRGKNIDAITREVVPTNEELKRICLYLPIAGKALTLLLSSSGMRIGESVKIKFEDIELDRKPARIKIRAEYTKTKRRRITFMSDEAKELLEEWLRYRSKYINKPRKSRLSGASSNCIFPFRAGNFNVMWRDALKKAGLYKLDSKTNRITMKPHSMRKFFRLRVGRVGRDEAEALMGHQEGLHRIYARFVGEDGERRLEEIYLKAIPELNIYDGINTQINKELLKKQDVSDRIMANMSVEYSAIKRTLGTLMKERNREREERERSRSRVRALNEKRDSRLNTLQEELVNIRKVLNARELLNKAIAKN